MVLIIHNAFITQEKFYSGFPAAPRQLFVEYNLNKLIWYTALQRQSALTTHLLEIELK